MSKKLGTYQPVIYMTVSSGLVWIIRTVSNYSTQVFERPLCRAFSDGYNWHTPTLRPLILDGNKQSFALRFNSSPHCGRSRPSATDTKETSTFKLCGANEAQRSLRPNERLVSAFIYPIFRH